MAAARAYCAWWLTGLLFLALEPRHRFIRFHAYQAVLAFGGLFAAVVVFWAGSFLSLLLVTDRYYFLIQLSEVVLALAAVLWAVCVAKAYRGATWRVQIVGRIAARWAYETPYSAGEVDGEQDGRERERP